MNYGQSFIELNPKNTCEENKMLNIILLLFEVYKFGKEISNILRCLVNIIYWVLF